MILCFTCMSWNSVFPFSYVLIHHWIATPLAWELVEQHLVCFYSDSSNYHYYKGLSLYVRKFKKEEKIGSSFQTVDAIWMVKSSTWPNTKSADLTGSMQPSCCQLHCKSLFSFSVPLTWIIRTAGCLFSIVRPCCQKGFSSLLLLDTALYLLCPISSITAFKTWKI